MAPTGAALVALAAFCWGLSGGIAAVLMADGWSASVVAFYRGVIGLVFLLAWVVLRRRGAGLRDRRFWFWSLIAGLGVAGNFTFYFLSIAEGSVAVAATLMYTAPIVVYLVSFLLGLERPTPGKWLAVALVMVGIVLLTRVDQVGGAAITVTGVAAGLMSALCYALFIFGFKYAVPRGSPSVVLTIAFAVLVAVLAWPAGFDAIRAVPGSADWSGFLALGVLGAGVSFVLYLMGLRRTEPALAAIVAMVEPVTASLFGIMVLSQNLGLVQLAGMGLILVTVTATGVRSAREWRAFQ